MSSSVRVALDLGRLGLAPRVLLALVLILVSGVSAAAAPSKKFPGIGRDATPAEVRAWDIDVRADFKDENAKKSIEEAYTLARRRGFKAAAESQKLQQLAAAMQEAVGHFKI